MQANVKGERTMKSDEHEEESRQEKREERRRGKETDIRVSHLESIRP